MTDRTAVPRIVWFRDDLRLSDHPALHAAADTGAPVICVYVFDEATEGLDAATAALVIENIRSETRGRAVLLATHHRDEAEKADKLIWIEHGKLMQTARRGEAAFDAILDQLNPRGCRHLDPGRGESIELQLA